MWFGTDGARFSVHDDDYRQTAKEVRESHALVMGVGVDDLDAACELAQRSDAVVERFESWFFVRDLDGSLRHRVPEARPLTMSARLIEIELRVADVERSRRFYRDVIGVPVSDLETHGADTEPHAHATWGEWAGTEPTLLMLNIYPVAGEMTRSRLGFAVSDLDALHERLRAAGATVARPPESRPWGRTASYYIPDGNTVSLTQTPR